MTHSLCRNQPFHSHNTCVEIGSMSHHPTQQTWAHDVPPQMPWSAPVDPGVMRFTAQQTSHSFSPAPQPITPTNPVLISSPPIVVEPPDEPAKVYEWKKIHGCSLKRRNSSSDEDDDESDLQPPPKVHAGADRVAAKLSHLDIDSDNERLTVEELSDDSQDEIEDGTQDEIQDEMDEVAQPVVHLSDEVKSVLASGQSDTMSQMLQNDLDRNSKALVLWKPLVNPLQSVLEEDDDLSTGVTIEEIFDDDDRMELA